MKTKHILSIVFFVVWLTLCLQVTNINAASCTPTCVVNSNCIAKDTCQCSSNGFVGTDVSNANCSIVAPVTNLLTTSVTSNSVALSWNHIFSSGISFTICETLKTNICHVTSSKTDTFTGLTPSDTFSFKISAEYTNAGQTYYTNTDTTITNVVTLPGNPTGFTYTSIAPNSITLQWDPLTGGDSAITYYIDQGAGKVLVNSNPVTITGLTASNSYTFSLFSRNAAGTYCTSPATLTSIVTPPNDVTGSITTSAITTTGMTLTWTAVSAGNVAVNYQVCMMSPSVSCNNVTGAVTYSPTGLSSSTTYQYSVVSRNTHYVSSSPITVTETTLPDAPTGFKASSVGSDTLSFTWNSVSAGNAGPITYYICYNSGATCQNTQSLTATFTGLSSSTTFNNIEIYAQNNVGKSSSKTTIASAQTLPLAPASVSTSSVTATSMTVAWDASSGSDITYHVCLDDGSACRTTEAPSTSISLTSLVSSNIYNIVVYASNTAGNSQNSNATTTECTLPSSVTSFAAPSSTNDSISLTWTVSSGGNSQIYYNITSDTPGVTAYNLAKATNSYTMSSLVSSATYKFYITTFNAYGKQATTVPTVTKVTFPKTPTGFSVTGTTTDTQINLQWNAVTIGDVSVTYDVCIVSGTCKTGLTTTSTNFASLTPSNSYSFTVVSKNSAGSSATSSVSESTLPPTVTSPSASSSSTTQATVTWTAVTAGNVSPKKYDVCNTVTGVCSLGITGNSYIDTGLSPSTTYSWSIRTFNGLKYSATNVTASTTTLPETPTLSLESVTHNSVSLSWNSVSAGNNAPITYSVCKTSPSPSACQNGLSGTTTTFSGLSSSTTYGFQIQAVNGKSISSTSSATLTAVTKPQAPTTLQIINVQTQQFTASWTASTTDNAGSNPITYYACINGLNCQTTTSTSVIFSSLISSNSYTVEVAALNKAGYSPTNLTVSDATTLPAAPANFKVTGTTTTSAVSLVWDTVAVGNAPVTYTVDIQSGGSGSQAGLTTNTYTFSSLTASQIYTFRVVAKNAKQTSSASTVIETTIPNNPTGLKVTTVNPTSIALSWDAVATGTSATKYSICTSDHSSCVLNSASTTATVSNLQSSSYYTFILWTVNAAAKVSAANATVSTNTIPQTPGDFVVSNTNATSVSLQWSVVPVGTVGSIHYDVCSSDGRICSLGLAVSVNQVTFNGLVANTYYTFNIRAVNSLGQNSPNGTVTAFTNPSAPVGLTVSYLTDSVANLTWSASTESTFTDETYDICTNDNRCFIGTSQKYAYFTGLTSNQMYTFYLRSKSSSGLISNNVTISTSTLSVVPTGFTTTYINASAITLKWNTVTGGNAGAISYVVCQTETSECITTFQTSYTFTLLTNSNYYNYKLYSLNGAGVRSIGETTLKASTLPAQVTNVRSSSITNTQATISWDSVAPGTVGNLKFSVCTSDLKKCQLNLSVKTATFTSLASSTSYTFNVWAVDAAGKSSEGNSSITIGTYPDAMTGLTVQSTSSSNVKVGWNVISTGSVGGIVYEVCVNTTNALTCQYISHPTNTATFNNLISSTNYNIIGACKNALDLFSLTNTTVPTTTNPDSVTGLTFNHISPTYVQLLWNAIPVANSESSSPIQLYRVCTLDGNYCNQTSGTRLDFTGLTASNYYTFSIYGENVNGKRSITTFYTNATKPSQPISLTGAAIDTSSIKVDWAASSNGNCTIDFYQIYYKTGSSDVSSFKVASNKLTSTLNYLIDNTKYTIGVSSINRESLESDINYIQVVTYPTNAGLTISQDSTQTTSSQVTFTWTQPSTAGSEALSYHVEWSGYNITSNNVNQTDRFITIPSSISSSVNIVVHVKNSAGESSGISFTGHSKPTTVGTFSMNVASIETNSAQIVITEVEAMKGDLPIQTYFINSGSVNYSYNNKILTVYNLQSGTKYTLCASTGNQYFNSSDCQSITFTTINNAMTGLSLLESSENTLSLQWTNPVTSEPYSTYVAYSSYDGNTIDYNNMAKVYINNPQTTTQYIISNLVTGNRYYITVFTANAGGNSANATLITATAPKTVSSITQTVINANTATITWTAPATNGNSPIVGYNLYLDGVYYNSTSSETSTLQLNNLKSSNEYQLTMKAYNNYTSSVLSTAQKIVTLAEAPTNVKASSDSGSDIINVAWSIPVIGNLPITNYILVLSYNNGTVRDTLTIASNLNSTSLTHLPYSTYFNIQLHSVNSAGNGPKSSLVSSGTIPYHPNSLQLDGVTKSSISVSWKAPEYNGDVPITNYVVELITVGSNNAPQTVDVPSTQLNYVFNLLESTTNYSINVYTKNTFGKSSASNNLQVKTLSPTAPEVAPTNLKVIDIQRQNITLTWTQIDKSANGGISNVFYRIYCRRSDAAASDPSIITNTAFNADNIVILGLEAGFNYTCKIAAVNSVGEGPSTTSGVEVTTLNPVPPASIDPSSITVEVSYNKIVVAWKAPDNGGRPVNRVHVKVTLVSSNFNARSLQSTNAIQLTIIENENNVTVTDLDAGAKYQVSIQLENSVGTSPATVVSASTWDPTNPTEPRDLTANAPAYNTIEMKWSEPTFNGGAAISYYNVRLLSSSDSVINTFKVNSTQLTMSELQGSTAYKMVVQAVSKVGLISPDVTTSATTPASPVTPPPVDNGGGSNIGAIVGGVIGGIIFIVAVIVFIAIAIFGYLHMKNRNKVMKFNRKEHEQYHTEEMHDI
ncbi:hypothetical protein ABK040_013072 [Willaertia magna]